MLWPSGTGKSMLAKRIPLIMPEITEEDAIESNKMLSVTGSFDTRKNFLAAHPFREPHCIS